MCLCHCTSVSLQKPERGTTRRPSGVLESLRKAFCPENRYLPTEASVPPYSRADRFPSELRLVHASCRVRIAKSDSALPAHDMWLASFLAFIKNSTWRIGLNATKRLSSAIR